MGFPEREPGLWVLRKVRRQAEQGLRSQPDEVHPCLAFLGPLSAFVHLAPVVTRESGPLGFIKSKTL